MVDNWLSEGAVETQRIVSHFNVQQKILLDNLCHSAKIQKFMVAFVL